jgi:hypothetical protein
MAWVLESKECQSRSLCTLMRPLSLTITKPQCPQVHLCVKNSIPEGSGNTHGKKIWKATQRVLCHLSQIHYSPGFWHLSKSMKFKTQLMGMKISPSPLTHWLKSPAESLGHDCCFTIDRPCPTLLLLSLFACECFVSTLISFVHTPLPTCTPACTIIIHSSVFHSLYLNWCSKGFFNVSLLWV